MDPKKRTSEFAIASLVLGIATFFNWVNLDKAIITILFAALAIKAIKEDPSLRGKTQAVAGIVLGGIGLIVYSYVLITVVLPQLQQAR